MTWKSTAVISGAGLVATWLASYAPSRVPPPAATVAPVSASDSAARDAAVRDAADRLHTRIRGVVEYREPGRNPFRFEVRATASARESSADSLPAAPTVPPAPPVRFSGIATDLVEGRAERTAILSTPSGLVFAREGDHVAGQRISAIGEDSVELTAPDGSRVVIR